MGKANRNSHLTIRGEERRRRVLNKEIAGPVKSKNELDVIMMKNAVQRDSDKLKFVGPFIQLPFWSAEVTFCSACIIASIQSLRPLINSVVL